MPLALLSTGSTLDFLKNVCLVATDMDGTLTYAGKFRPGILEAFECLARVNVTVLVITGRSAGWVSGLVSYLPIVGAIAENGGLFYLDGEMEPNILVDVSDLVQHRHRLATMFHALRAEFPQLQESADNQFRLTDWTFGVEGLSQAELQYMRDRCIQADLSFTYSTVQCHIKLPGQDKAAALTRILYQYFPQYSLQQIVTVGDSPNDESLFDGDRFPYSVGVANVLHYADQLAFCPAYVTSSPEATGFCELTDAIVTAKKGGTRR
jgi:HAD superfamily hydrolase (TIGR01484 family)